MEQGNVNEESQMGGTSAVPHQDHNDWAAHAHHYTQNQQNMENVVQIIVPELNCLNQGSSDNLGTTISEGQANVEFISANNNSPIVGPNAATFRGNALRGVKDSLSALAAAAELDQQNHLNNLIGEAKFITISADKKMSSNVLSDISDKENTTVEVFRSCSYENKVLSYRPLPLAPFLSTSDPDVTFYNEVYHYLCSATFPDGASEVYKRLIKKRASNYMINAKGELLYGIKGPRQVITNLNDQKRILQTSHVEKDTGVHNGVRKMYSLIFGRYYWRSMYVDIGNFVRSCEKCSDSTVLLQDAPSRKSEETVTSTELPVAALSADRIMRVWKKVQVRVYGPFEKTLNGNEYLITMIDPFSAWILARPSPKDRVEHVCANFIFESFCNFGFAQCQVVGMTSESFEAMQTRYRDKFDGVQDIFRGLVPFDSEDAQRSFMFTLQENSSECSWADEMIDDMCISNPDSWDEDITRLLFHFCTSKPHNGGASPFSIMFARNPTGYVSAEEKENIDILEGEKALETPTTTRRRLRSSTLQCRHCYETFTSKISFRIHQRKHTEEARRRGTLDGEKRLSCLLVEKKNLLRSKRRRKPFGRGSDRLLTMVTCDWSDQSNEEIQNCIRHQLTQSTVEAVKNLLMATKEERGKRGKYLKYTQELRDEIAQYALDHSIPAATTYWSARLGNTVSESSIRNFIRNLKSFSPDTKEEIGKYAFHNGIEKAVQYFSEKLGISIRKGIVIKFKKFYIKKFQDENSEYLRGESNSAPSTAKRSQLSTRQKRSFSHQIKEEIGRYASLHSITAAIDHFTVKLQFPVKESTVRKFKRQYMERNSSNLSVRNDNAGDHIVQDNGMLSEQQQQQHQQQQAQQQQQQQQQNQHQGHSSMDIHSLSVLSAPSSVPAHNNFVYQHPYSLNMSAGASTNTAVIPMNPNSLTFHQGGVINPGVASLSYQQTTSGTPAVIMNQAFPQVGHPPSFQQGYLGGFAQSGTGNNGVSSQGTPLAIAHTSPSSMVPHNSPLQLTMGGNHSCQINSVSVAQSHTMGAHALQAPHSSSHQLVASAFHQHVQNSLPFESVVPLGNHSNVTLNSEPLSLMKGNTQGVEALQGESVTTGTEGLQEGTVGHGNSVGASGIQEGSVSVSATVNGIPASIIHISHLETPSHALHHPQNPHAHQYHKQEQHQQQQQTQHHHSQQQQHQPPSQHHHQPSDQVSAENSSENVMEEEEEAEILGLEDEYSNSPPQTPKRKKTRSRHSRGYSKSSSYTCGKRGNYVSYSPELRAEIGKYAAEQGNLAAITHFKEKLNIEIPESTVRGLKDKYMIKKMRGEKEVKSLGFAQRGRPMRLGKYDFIVQECIKELLKGGEKVSSFLVIATAKQVLMQYDPSLLEENGGPVKLNPTWAKSFLKRIGLSYSS